MVHLVEQGRAGHIDQSASDHAAHFPLGMRLDQCQRSGPFHCSPSISISASDRLTIPPIHRRRKAHAIPGSIPLITLQVAGVKRLAVGCTVLCLYIAAYCTEIVRGGASPNPPSRRLTRSFGMTYAQCLTLIVPRPGHPGHAAVLDRHETRSGEGLSTDPAVSNIKLMRSSPLIVSRVQEPPSYSRIPGLPISIPIARIRGHRKWVLRGDDRGSGIPRGLWEVWGAPGAGHAAGSSGWRLSERMR